MKINVTVKLNLRVDEAKGEVREAVRLGLRDTIVAVHNEAVKNAPPTYKTPWTTGNNRRSIAAEVSGMGLVATGGEGGAEHMVDDSKLEAAVYSTSGYGGYLETGTWKMAARPYFRPALDMHKDELGPNVKRHMP